MPQDIHDANDALRKAVSARMESQAAGVSSDLWYEGSSEPKKPGSLKFMEAVEEIKQTHIKKSQDYGDPTDPLANVRAGAELVGIEPWRGCVIRIADKMQRIKSFCREHIAGFKVPRDIRVVKELPRNPTGKIMRRKLSAATPCEAAAAG